VVTGTQSYRLKTDLYPHLQPPRMEQTKQKNMGISKQPVHLEMLQGLKPNDFDRAIMYGRDQMLFIKREALDSLTVQTRYTEPELKNLKEVYVEIAKPQYGLHLESFQTLIGLMLNIEHHPFIKEMFVFFDRNADGKVDFEELIRGLDIIERGTFDEKCRYCFELYDIFAMQELDIVTLRSLFKRVFSTPIIKLEEAIAKVDQWPKQQGLQGWTWSDFEMVLLPVIQEYMPTIFDKIELNRNLISELEVRFGFTLESLEELWNVTRPRTI
jgi:Ca2+-binding EF-hand superfamily protein